MKTWVIVICLLLTTAIVVHTLCENYHMRNNMSTKKDLWTRIFDHDVIRKFMQAQAAFEKSQFLQAHTFMESCFTSFTTIERLCNNSLPSFDEITNDHASSIFTQILNLQAQIHAKLTA